MATHIGHRAAPRFHATTGFSRRGLWALVLPALLIAALVALRFVGGDVLRARVEATLNEHLTGYTVRLPDLELNLLGFGLRLIDVSVIQNAHPKPPVAQLATMTLAVDWRALLRFRLVADLTLASPRLHIDRRQLVAEASDSTDLDERGWQDAVEAIYPLKINHFRITDGSLTYIDCDPNRPLRLSGAAIVAENIRNVHSEEGSYPSRVKIDATLFRSGGLHVDGRADFLARPFAAVDADVELKTVPLDSLDPVSDEVSIRIREGVLSGEGHVEYGPRIKKVHLRRLRVDGVKVSYVQNAGTSVEEAKRAQVAEATGEGLSRQADTHLLVDRVELRGSELAYASEAQGYRLVFADTDVTVRDVSNRDQSKAASFDAAARFMDAGPATLRGGYRPGAKRPDFELDLRIEATPLPALNDLFRAYGDFDVVGGMFALYSEMAVRDGQLRGYVKPLFTDMDVYDRRQDQDRSIVGQAYEGLVGGVSTLLENRREDVAAKVDLSGPLSNPDVSALQTVLSLIQNAFFRAILPGFERQAARK